MDSTYRNNSYKLKRLSAFNCEHPNGSVQAMDLLNGAIKHVYERLLTGRATYYSESQLVGLILQQVQFERQKQFGRKWRETVLPPEEMPELLSPNLPTDLWMELQDTLDLVDKLPVKLKENYHRIWNMKMERAKLTREDYRLWQQATTLLQEMRDAHDID